MPTKNRAWPAIAVAFTFAVITLIIIFTYSTVWRPTANNETACKDNSGIEICISSTANPKVVSSKITNNTSSVYTANFTSTCTEPTLFINEVSQNRAVACGQALTIVKIEPGSSKTYENQIPNEFNRQSVSVVTSWNKLTSGKIVISIP